MKALRKDFSEGEINEMFRRYDNLLTPQSGITQLQAGLTGEYLIEYPLSDFKKEKLYSDNINSLINSENKNHRILAYLVIGSSRDISFEKILLEKIKKEKLKGNLIWAGMSLLYLKTDQTTPLFDFLVENENFGDAHMLPLYITLNKDSLINTAYQRINSENIKAKILAIQLLSKSELNTKTELTIKKAVREWDIGIKGYAIYSMKELEMGNVSEVLKPLLDSTKTRKIALEALANSPTKTDQDFYFNLFEQKDSIENDLLNSLLNSKRIENIRYWLKLLYKKKVSTKYYFAAYNQPLLYEAEILEDFQLALSKIENAKVLTNLVRAFEGKTDKKSIDIYLNLLHHKNSSVRYWTAKTLRGTKTKKIINKIPDLLFDEKTRSVELTNIAIENNIDTLQEFFEKIYAESKGDWKRSSLEYLSRFPLAKHKSIFLEVLESEENDSFGKREAATGLGNLKEVEAIDLIVSVMLKESEPSDLNARSYLIALGKMETDKANQVIESFKDSEESIVRELVNELIREF